MSVMVLGCVILALEILKQEFAESLKPACIVHSEFQTSQGSTEILFQTTTKNSPISQQQNSQNYFHNDIKP